MGGHWRIDCRASAEETDDHNATASSQNLVVVAHCGRARNSGVARRGAVGLGPFMARRTPGGRRHRRGRGGSHPFLATVGDCAGRGGGARRVRAARHSAASRPCRRRDLGTRDHGPRDRGLGDRHRSVGLRFRRSAGGPRELLDGLTVAAGAGLTAWITLANPAIDGGMHPGLAVLATAYLPMTIMLVTFAAELMLEGLVRNRAMWLVISGLFAALGGAIVRALVQAGELHSGWQTTSTALLVVADRAAVRSRVAPGFAAHPRAAQSSPARDAHSASRDDADGAADREPRRADRARRHDLPDLACRHDRPRRGDDGARRRDDRQALRRARRQLAGAAGARAPPRPRRADEPAELGHAFSIASPTCSRTPGVPSITQP